MRKKILLQHCDDNPKEMEIEDGDKVGFVCEKCKKLFEMDSNGNISIPNIKSGDIISNKHLCLT